MDPSSVCSGQWVGWDGMAARLTAFKAQLLPSEGLERLVIVMTGSEICPAGGRGRGRAVPLKYLPSHVPWALISVPEYLLK